LNFTDVVASDVALNIIVNFALRFDLLIGTEAVCSNAGRASYCRIRCICSPVANSKWLKEIFVRRPIIQLPVNARVTPTIA
jgi:hypothetical protein